MYFPPKTSFLFFYFEKKMNPKVVRYVPENKDLATSSEEFRF
jgi:hypothetical protein